jgi:hypothetical protein
MIADELNKIQLFLGDAPIPGDDGTFWTRAELLDAYNDGYRQFLSQSQAVKRWHVLDVPPRHTATGRYEWESRFAQGGTFWCHTIITEGGWACDHLWEAQVLEDITAQAASEGITQQWERAYQNPSQVHYRFALPRDSERVAGIWYDHRRLVPVSVRQLDAMERDWMSLGGYPLAWTQGIGRARTFEIYEIVTANQQVYQRTGSAWGIPRYRAGARTYGYTSQNGTFYGIPRRLMSPERQYLATQGVWGAPRRYASSVGTLLVLEVVGPEVPDLHEEDTPALLPPQLWKYLRYYTLAEVWSGQGEGRRDDLAALCRQVFAHGVQVLKNLSWLTMRDEQMARPPRGHTRDRAWPHAQLPSTYPRTYP